MAGSKTQDPEKTHLCGLFTRKQWLELASREDGVEVTDDEDDGYPDEEDAQPLHPSQLQTWDTETGITRATLRTHLHDENSCATESETSRNDRDDMCSTPATSHHASEMNRDGADETRSKDSTVSTEIDITRARYNSIKSDVGLYDLFQTALKDEMAKFETSNGPSDPQAFGMGYMVLISTHPRILQAVMEGNVAQLAFRDPSFRDILKEIKRQAEKQTWPAVYLNQIGDTKGRTPTPNQLLFIIPQLLDYVYGRDAQFISKIDRMHNTSRTTKLSSNKGQPGKYVYSQNGLSKTRQEKTAVFLRALRARCLSVDEGFRDSPMPGWLSEVGYTHTTETRLRNHKAHTSSNYIMNLVESALSLSWPQHFDVHQFIIFLCTDPSQAVLAEVIFTRLSLCGIRTGGGFTHYPPGLSNESANRYRTEDWDGWWEWNTQFCGTIENDKKEVKRWEDSQDKRKRLLAYNKHLEDETERIRSSIPEEIHNRLRGLSTEEIEQRTDEVRQQCADQAKKIEEIKCKIDGIMQFFSGINRLLDGESIDSDGNDLEVIRPTFLDG